GRGGGLSNPVGVERLVRLDDLRHASVVKPLDHAEVAGLLQVLPRLLPGLVEDPALTSLPLLVFPDRQPGHQGFSSPACSARISALARASSYRRANWLA